MGEKQLLRELKEDSKMLMLAWSARHPSLSKNVQLTNWRLPPEVPLEPPRGFPCSSPALAAVEPVCYGRSEKAAGQVTGASYTDSPTCHPRSYVPGTVGPPGLTAPCDSWFSKAQKAP